MKVVSGSERVFTGGSHSNNLRGHLHHRPSTRLCFHSPTVQSGHLRPPPPSPSTVYTATGMHVAATHYTVTFLKPAEIQRGNFGPRTIGMLQVMGVEVNQKTEKAAILGCSLFTHESRDCGIVFSARTARTARTTWMHLLCLNSISSRFLQTTGILLALRSTQHALRGRCRGARRRGRASCRTR